MISNDIQGIGMTSQRTRDRLVERLREKGIKNERVLEVIRTTPRHIFVDEAMAHRAYEDTALPIGHGQTISQPYIVARMTEILLEGGTPDVVLEVGTGSGYQSAILSRLVPKVYTVERISALLQKARNAHHKLGLLNVFSRHSDGSWGWEPKAPYNAIMVTAEPQSVHPSMLEQLDVGVSMVIPVGTKDGVQQLKVYTRTAECIEESTQEYVHFVPLLDGAVRS